MTEKNIPTRTKDTKEFYRVNTRRYLVKFMQERDLVDGSPIDPVSFAVFVIRHKENLTASSWRLYKASFIFSMSEGEMQNWPGYFKPEIFAQAVSTLKIEGASGTKASGRVNKAKIVARERLDKIVGVLNRKAERKAKSRPEISRGLALTRDWLLANLLVGLRPSEWENAEMRRGPLSAFIDADQILSIELRGKENEDRKAAEKQLRNYMDREVSCLVVKNAKNTNGRACGEERYLVLDGFPAADISLIEHVLAELKHAAGTAEFKKIYNRSRQHLKEANYALWGHPSDEKASANEADERGDGSGDMDEEGNEKGDGFAGDDFSGDDESDARDTFGGSGRPEDVGMQTGGVTRKRKFPLIGLYSARHQFAANAKAKLSGRAAAVAGLMGHASDRTAYLHYARASDAGANLRKAVHEARNAHGEAIPGSGAAEVMHVPLPGKNISQVRQKLDEGIHNKASGKAAGSAAIHHGSESGAGPVAEPVGGKQEAAGPSSRAIQENMDQSTMAGPKAG